MYQHHSRSGFVGNKPTNGSFQNNNSSNPMQVSRNKSNYCWNFNKGVPCKFGAKCKFIERCKYYDSPSHGVNTCQKLQKKEGFKAGGSNGNNNAGSSNESK